MGNYASCALAGQNGKQSKAAKVILPSGEIKHFYQPIKAAELMLDIPNHFVVGRRLSAMNADEDLEIAAVYVMFPMKRVKAFVTAADMGALFLAAKRGAGKVRVVPACSGHVTEVESPAPAPYVDSCGVKMALDELCSPEFKHRMSVCRSKKPLLETIVEEPR
ncbi:hypothetical protein Cgig2_022345 [Carnegiea gigantea]|uniref:Uncharacterized protein n=1 Tax=Carnegiea gigantea TaxID=171969 RepID=A0A9Q1KFT3_9CARY|nr:hypothetical protein Cgig2_022345 [Carnegiea gigantea]